MKGFKFNFDWLPIFDGEYASFHEEEDIYNSIMAIFCVICAGLAAGLTMGMVSLDLTKLEVKTLTGSPSEQRDAKSVLPVVKRHHFLLVTLLLFNSISNESLPIFLGALFPNWVAILISVSMVLIFGEIIPSALFTGSVQLRMAAYFVPFVLFLMTIFWPIAFPISKILDFIFGAEEHNSALSRDDFQALVTLQGIQRERLKNGESGNANISHYGGTNESTPLISDRECQTNSNLIRSFRTFHCDSIEEGYESYIADNESSQGQNHGIRRASSRDSSYLSHPVKHERDASLSNEELSILSGVLRLSNRTVHDVMIPMSEVCMLSDTNVLNYSCLNDILSTGYSRIPVYRGLDRLHMRVRGYLLVKSLAVLNPDDEIPLNSLALREPIFLRPNVSLLEALGTFRRSRCHIAIVCDDPLRAVRCMRSQEFLAYEPKMLGIITMEDCIEEIIQDEIEDETDVVRSSGAFTPLSQNIAVGNRRKGSVTERERVGQCLSAGEGGFTSRGHSRPTTPSLTGHNVIDLGLNTPGVVSGSSALRHNPNASLSAQD